MLPNQQLSRRVPTATITLVTRELNYGVRNEITPKEQVIVDLKAGMDSVHDITYDESKGCVLKCSCHQEAYLYFFIWKIVQKCKKRSFFEKLVWKKQKAKLALGDETSRKWSYKKQRKNYAQATQKGTGSNRSLRSETTNRTENVLSLERAVRFAWSEI